MAPGCLPAFALLALLFLFPLILAEVVLGALAKLALPPPVALLAFTGILLGGLVNIPVKEYVRTERVEPAPGLFGLDWLFPRGLARQQRTVLAVNVGGCVIPCLVALYEIDRIVAAGEVLAVVVVVAVNVVVCHRFARTVPGLGIALPTLLPALVAALGAILLAPEFAPPVAFVAGVVGPLVGADLLHLDEVKHSPTGVASIGGAGTFDGIVISGLLATLLA